MASIGLRKPFVAPLSSSGTYGEPATIGKAISVNVTPNYAEGSLFADDHKAEEDKEFTDATVELGTSTIPISFNNAMFGHTVTDGETTYNSDDETKYVGLGFIGVEKVDGVRKFVGTFLPKVKFAEPGKNYTTRGDSITYNTPSLSGSAMALDDGDWKYDKVCDTESEAETWIRRKFQGNSASGTQGS